MTFDMQKARAVCEKAALGPWVAWGGRITPVGKFACELFNAGLYCRQEDIMFVVGARTLLPAALDEIERLIHSVDETVIQLGACRFVAKHIQNEQAKQIETLKAALQTAIAYEIACRLFLMPLNHCSIEQKRAALSDARNHIGEYIEEGTQLAREMPEIFGEDEI